MSGTFGVEETVAVAGVAGFPLRYFQHFFFGSDGHARVIKLEPLVVHFYERVIMAALGISRMVDDCAQIKRVFIGLAPLNLVFHVPHSALHLFDVFFEDAPDRLAFQIQPVHFEFLVSVELPHPVHVVWRLVSSEPTNVLLCFFQQFLGRFFVL